MKKDFKDHSYSEKLAGVGQAIDRVPFMSMAIGFSAGISGMDRGEFYRDKELPAPVESLRDSIASSGPQPGVSDWRYQTLMSGPSEADASTQTAHREAGGSGLRFFVYQGAHEPRFTPDHRTARR